MRSADADVVDIAAGTCASDAGRVVLQGIASIAGLTSLTALTLCDCNAVTGNGLGALSALTRLVALTVVRCDKVVAGGFAGVVALPRLALLDVYGCVKARASSVDVDVLMRGCHARCTGTTCARCALALLKGVQAGC